MRLLIADDHPIVRQGIRRILAPQAKKIDEASTVPELRELLAKNRYDCAVLDISMPGGAILETLKEIQTRHPGVPVLVLSMHPEEQYAVRVLRAGAAGYLNKESAPELLGVAVEKIVRGGKFVSPKVAELLAQQLRDKPAATTRHEVLSDREFTVLLMIGGGKPLTDIARELCLSVKTVSTYRTRIMEKMGFRSTAEMIRYVVTQGLAA